VKVVKKPVLLFLLFSLFLFIQGCTRGCGENNKQDKNKTLSGQEDDTTVLKLFIAEKTSFKWSSDNPVSKRIAEKTGILLMQKGPACRKSLLCWQTGHTRI
jgi:hypothetical protein